MKLCAPIALAALLGAPTIAKNPHEYTDPSVILADDTSQHQQDKGLAPVSAAVIMSLQGNAVEEDTNVTDKGDISELGVETTTMEDFWAFADDTKTALQYDADEKLKYLEHASPGDLRQIAVQYRHFVERYPANLAMLVARLPYGKLRSLLATILAEELGEGKEEDAHIVWYDSFLRSIGVDEEAMQNVLPENDRLLNEIAGGCYNKPWSYAVGLVGMGGECLCQIYLTSMYKYLLRNPFIIAEGSKVDHHFWTYHTGPEDAAHRILVRNAISDIIDDEQAKSLLDGYKYGKLTWDEFWGNSYNQTGLFGGV